jgi:hypothetical protein
LHQHLEASESLVQERLANFRHTGELEAPGYLRWLGQR